MISLISDQLEPKVIEVPPKAESSPILFTQYTNECTSRHPDNYIVQFSDNIAILCLIYRD